jgi:glucan endo-1,3-beta-D-glucosidase
MIQGGTNSTPIEAIPAAIAEETSLLLGIWVSGGQSEVTNEILALTAAIQTYGKSFTDLVVGLSVGSEDLYRISPTGIENDSGIGASPADIVNYITQVKKALSGTPLSDVSIGHVDTWNAWTNGSNSAVIEAIDWLGVDEYPYFQNTESNSIDNAYSLFWAAYNATSAAAGGKPVWITETGWPVSGKTENLAIASLSNAQTFWDEVGCASAFDKINTWWYVLQDAAPTAPNPSFGLVGSSTSDATLSTSPLYDLSCANVTLPSSLLPSSTATRSASTVSGTGTPTIATGNSQSSSTKSSSASSTSSTSKSAGSGGSSLTASSSFLAYVMFAGAALF